MDRCDNYLPDLKSEIEAWTTTKTVDELEEIISGLKIPFGRIQTIPEAAEHPQTKERNMLWTVYQPGMNEEIRIPGTPIKIHGEPDECQKPAPQLGEDNEAILLSLGMTKEQVAALKEKGVLQIHLKGLRPIKGRRPFCMVCRNQTGSRSCCPT